MAQDPSEESSVGECMHVGVCACGRACEGVTGIGVEEEYHILGSLLLSLLVSVCSRERHREEALVAALAWD